MVFFSLFWINMLWGQTLPTLMTKQALEQIRYMSRDSRYVFTQKKNGALSFHTNYNTLDILQKTPGTHFMVSSSTARKIFLIEAEAHQHDQFHLNKINEIYSLKWGENKPELIGKGTFPELHLDDQWVSYYMPGSRELFFQNLNQPKSPIKIKLSLKHNVFFRPHSFMFSATQLFYTDVNEQGYPALVYYDVEKNQPTILYKSPFMGSRLELCHGDKFLALGEWGYDGANVGGAIFINPLQPGLLQTSQLKGIYKTGDADIGNMVCSADKIYFVKTLSGNRRLNLKTTEVAEINPQTTQVMIRSHLEKVTQIFEMDGRVLLPFREKIYVLEGHHKMNDDRLKKEEKVNL
jgi:hypothetical protein